MHQMFDSELEVGQVPGSPARLPDAFLDELAGALAQLGKPQRGVGFAALTRLAQRLPAAAAVTVDFTKATRLDAALVVVQLMPPASEPRPAPTPAGATLVPRAERVERAGRAAWAELTPRERDVAQRLCAGLSNKIIARELGLSLGTVKDYVHRILKKTGHASRARFAAAGLATAAWDPS